MTGMWSTRYGKSLRYSTTSKGSDYCYLHDPDPAVAERRRRNASHAATLGNSKIGAEIRSTRLMVRDLVETTVSGDLNPVVRMRLTEITQLIQSYCRLAELEIAAGERPRATWPCPRTPPKGPRNGPRLRSRGRSSGKLSWGGSRPSART